MIVSYDKKAAMLNDHYKDTFSNLAGYRKQRNRVILYSLITIVVIFLFALFPKEATPAILQAILNKLGAKTTDISPHPVWMYGFLVAVLLCMSIKYREYTMAIDNQYSYLQKLEAELNSLYPRSILFTRETNFSSKEHPTFAMWSNYFYGTLFSRLSYMSMILYILIDVRNNGFRLYQIGFVIGSCGTHVYLYRDRFKFNRMRAFISNLVGKFRSNPRKKKCQ